jgi:hypothetical protein
MGTILLFPFMNGSVRADPLVVLLSDYAAVITRNISHVFLKF